MYAVRLELSPWDSCGSLKGCGSLTSVVTDGTQVCRCSVLDQWWWGRGKRGGVKVCAHTMRGHVVMLHGTRSCGK